MKNQSGCSDMSEKNKLPSRPDMPSRGSLLESLIDQIGFVFFVTVLSGIYLIYFSSFQVPLFVKVFFIGGVGGAFIAIFPAKQIVDWLYNPQSVHIVVLDLTRKDYNFAVWRVDYETFGKVSVNGADYDLESVRSMKGHVYFAESFDPDSLEATGVWAGSVSSREMMVERGLIREIREELENDAQEVFTYRSKIGSIVRDAFKQVMFDNIEAQERNTMYRGDKIADIVQEKVEEAGIDDPSSDDKTVKDKKLEQMKTDGTPEYEPPDDDGAEE